MALLIQKFGGSSVASTQHIQHVAERVAAAHVRGDQVVVVLSAMQGETDRLISLAKGVAEQPDLREYDALLATGEQVSTALLAMCLRQLGVDARSYNSMQLGLYTEGVHKRARIARIETDKLREDLSAGRVPVITGFQGVSEAGDWMTLGRGGSDTTAVALAAVLQADECQIYTDVEGVYTADPRVVESARLMQYVTFEEMLELASLGAKVLQIRAVEFAGKYNVPLRVLSTFTEGEGTFISYEDPTMETALVSGVAHDRNQAQLTILSVPNQADTIGRVLGALSDKHIELDMIVQSVPSDELINLSFSVQRDDFEMAKALLEVLAQEIGGAEVVGNDRMAKVSAVGVGMRSHPGVATRLFRALGAEGIQVKLITTSEIKVSVLVEEKYLELSVRTLHDAFELSSDSV